MDTATILLITLAVLVSTLLFRRWSSSKRLPPGPAGWPIVGNLLQLGTKPHVALDNLAKQYGPLITLKFGFQNVVFASSPKTAAAFLKTHDTSFANRPFTSLSKYMFYDGQDLTSSPYGPRLKLMRSLLSMHILSPSALDEFRNIRQDETLSMVQRLAAASDRPIHIGQWLYACTTNNLTRMMMGRRMFTNEAEPDNEEVREFKGMALEVLNLAGAFPIADFLPFLKWLDLDGMVTRMKKTWKKYDGFLEKLIAEYSASNTKDKHPNMFTKLMELKDQPDEDGRQLNLTEVKALLLDLFVAGSDSTTVTIEWVMSELLRHPEIIKKAQQEIDSVAGKDRLVEESDISRLPLLQAIVKEGLRLHPPAPINIPHYNYQDVEIEGYLIPKNTMVFVNLWGMGRNPEIWAEPMKFQPERFLPGGTNAKTDIKGSDFDLIPFSAGRRMCIGMNLGLRMVHLAVAGLLHAFDWELPAGQLPEKVSMEEIYGLSVQRKEPLNLYFRPRLAPHVYSA